MALQVDGAAAPVRVRKIVLIPSAAAIITITRRSTTSGAGTVITLGQLDTTDAAATAVARLYTVVPVAGTSVADLAIVRAGADGIIVEEFADLEGGEECVLRATQFLTVSVDAALTMRGYIEFEEGA